MSTLLLTVLIVNVAMVLVISVLWIRVSRPPKEDPRLSRGLQLLQSKIAVLEDLSDRTDRQVKQLVHILEEKARGLSQKLLRAEELLAELDHSAAKSRQMADIFEDKIPHDEIIERKNTAKYVRAAQMAHEGMSAVEISEALDIPESEADFIVKVNKDELSFDREALPDWAKSSEEEMPRANLSSVVTAAAPDLSSLNQVTQNFSEVVQEYRDAEARTRESEERAEERRRMIEAKRRELMGRARANISSLTQSVVDKAGEFLSEAQVRANDLVHREDDPESPSSADRS